MQRVRASENLFSWHQKVNLILNFRGAEIKINFYEGFIFHILSNIYF